MSDGIDAVPSAGMVRFSSPDPAQRQQRRQTCRILSNWICTSPTGVTITRQISWNSAADLGHGPFYNWLAERWGLGQEDAAAGCSV